MLKIIPTPIFMDVDKNKALKIKSLSLDESKINQAVVDDFYDFLDKLKIKVGDDCTVDFIDEPSLSDEEYRLETTKKSRFIQAASEAEFLPCKRSSKFCFNRAKMCLIL